MQKQYSTKILYAIIATKINKLKQQNSAIEKIRKQIENILFARYEKKRNSFFGIGKFFYKNKSAEQLLNEYHKFIIENNLVVFDESCEAYVDIDEPLKALFEILYSYNYHYDLISTLYEKLKTIIAAKQNLQHTLTKDESAILGI